MSRSVNLRWSQGWAWFCTITHLLKYWKDVGQQSVVLVTWELRQDNFSSPNKTTTKQQQQQKYAGEVEEATGEEKMLSRWGVEERAQLGRCLAWKYKELSSNPRTHSKQKPYTSLGLFKWLVLPAWQDVDQREALSKNQTDAWRSVSEVDLWLLYTHAHTHTSTQAHTRGTHPHTTKDGGKAVY